MLEYDWEKSPGFWITAASHSLRKKLDQRLSTVDLTFRQYEVLACLSVRDNATQAEIADAMGLTAPTLTGIIDRMVTLGLIDRNCCDEDKRRRIICPTTKAEELWKKVTPIAHQLREEALKGIPVEHLETLRDTLLKIRQNIGDPIVGDDGASGAE